MDIGEEIRRYTVVPNKVPIEQPVSEPEPEKEQEVEHTNAG